MRSIVNPRMMRSIPQFFNSEVTIADKIVSYNAENEETITYVANPQLTAIKCYREPASGAETRTPNQTYSLDTFILALKGYYPLIPDTSQAIVNGNQYYNIQRVTHDDTKTITFITCENVNAQNEQ